MRVRSRTITAILAAMALQMGAAAHANNETDDTRSPNSNRPSAIQTHAAQLETVARAEELARRLGLPPEAVERNLADINALVRAGDTAETANGNGNEDDWIRQEIQRQRQQGAGQAIVATATPQADTSEQFWGVIFGIWIVIVGVPYLVFTFAVAAKRMGIDDPRIWKLGAFWSPGFIALFPIHDYLPAPGFGIVWSVLYGVGATLVWKMGSRLLRWPESRTTRICLVALVSWVALVQAWGFIFDWTEHFEPGQFAALHVIPPIFVGAAWMARLWIGSAQR